jgi:predicted Zn-dependent protease
VRTLLIGVLLALTGTALHFGGQQLWAEYRFHTARQALARRQFFRARSDLEVCLRQWPKNPEAHFLAARIARQAGYLDEAARRLDLCQFLRGPRQAIALERALLRAQQGDLTPDLETYLRTTAESDPSNGVTILDALSEGYRGLYRLNDARDCLTSWLEQEPDSVAALLRRAWVLERLDQFEKARDDYWTALGLEPNNNATRLRLAQVLTRLGQTAELTEAAALFEGLQRQRPGETPVVLGLAQCRVRLGQVEEAQRLLDNLAAAQPGEASVLLERGRLALQQGDAAAAEPWLRRAAQRAPSDYQVCYALYQCLRQQGKDAEAKECRTRMQQVEADLLRLHDLTEQLQQRPYDAWLRCEIGKIFLYNGEKHEGELWLQTTLRIDPRYEPARSALADYYEATGRPEQAAAYRRTPPDREATTAP